MPDLESFAKGFAAMGAAPARVPAPPPAPAARPLGARAAAGMRDPEDPSVPERIRKLSSAVCSLGYDDGRFLIALPDRFLDHPLKGPPSWPTMREFLRRYGLMKDETHPNWNLEVVPGRDYLFEPLRKAGLAGPGTVDWAKWGPGRELPGHGKCSGFLVAGNIVMTNEHCMASQEKCSISSFRFGEELAPGLAGLKPVESLRCRKLLLKDKELDFALAEVEGRPGTAYGTLRLASRVPANREADFFIIGHPAGHGETVEPSFKSLKKVSGPCATDGGISETSYMFQPDGDSDIAMAVIDLERLFTRFEVVTGSAKSIGFNLGCRVFGGNSGGPVIDSQSRVIGLLHRGSGMDSRATAVAAIAAKYGAQLRSLGIELE